MWKFLDLISPAIWQDLYKEWRSSLWSFRHSLFSSLDVLPLRSQRHFPRYSQESNLEPLFSALTDKTYTNSLICLLFADIARLSVMSRWDLFWLDWPWYHNLQLQQMRLSWAACYNMSWANYQTNRILFTDLFTVYIKIDSNSYEKVKTFKYLGCLLTNQNSIQEEIKCRLKAGNSCYYSVQTLLS